ncbi:hypothetical protein [Nonomuraea sp. B19D2]|uniref:hypothetical protein n=1 Tax=Nonomuraea sp. B19D2 TaxID=3159561 RepID=UPI0032DBCF76
MNSTSVVTEAAILAEVNKGVGVVIAVIGAIIISPAGWRALLQPSASWMRAQFDRIRKPSPQPLSLSASGSGETFGNTTIMNAPPPRLTDQPVADQVAMVYAYLRSVEGRLNQLMTSLADEKSARDKQLAELAATLQGRFDKLEDRMIEQERQAARIDARGLPVIATGIVLSGIPEWLAALPLRIGWALPVIGLLLTGRVLGSLRPNSS